MMHYITRTRTSLLLSSAALMTLSLINTSCSDNLTQPPNLQAYEPTAIEPLTCVPNLDGKIEASELREAFGIPARYLVTPAGSTRGVDLAGLVRGDERLWDWSARYDDERLGDIQASELSGKWYASSFPKASFVASADLGGRLENIYSRDDKGFYLHGVASSEEDPQEGKTLIVYEQPVALYQFPLEVGKQWITIGRATNSTVRGLPYAGKDTYEINVEASGRLVLPDLTFDQAYQVFTKVTLEPSVGQSVTTRQVSFLFECFGEVARATSATDEQETYFTTATEVRRLGIGYNEL